MKFETVSARFFLMIAVATCTFLACSEEAEITPRQPEAGTGLLQRSNYTDPPHVRTYPSPPTTIQAWIDAVDSAKIRQHGWDIWESITSPSKEPGVPVWETWYSGAEVFNPDDAKAFSGLKFQRDFQRPAQFHHAALMGGKPGAIARDTNEEVTAFNRYTKSLANFIVNKGFNRQSVLDSINAAFDSNSTPVAQRSLSTSADTVDGSQIVLKPVFQFIDGTKETVLPYWLGNDSSETSRPDTPTVNTWKQAVVIDPSGKLKPGDTVTRQLNGVSVKCKVVSLDDFYFVKLDSAQAAAFSQFAETSGDDVGQGNNTDSGSVAAMVKAGNYALLVAMHVTTKEIVNWTWQTFYWSPDPQDPLYGADRPKSIPKPWSNYNMHVAYFMVIPPGSSSGTTYVSYNPYLETNLGGNVTRNGVNIIWHGVQSNCMSCHRMATWGPGGSSAPYVPNGQISPDTAWFDGLTKTDFLWSIPTRAFTAQSAK